MTATATATATATTTVPLLVPIAPAVGAAGRDKVAGPVCSLGNADHLLATRRPFRTGFRTNEWTGFSGHSVAASLYRVDLVDRPRYAPESVVLVGAVAGLADGLGFGSAPDEVRDLFRDELAAAIDAAPAGHELQCYLVRSYETPIAWGFHHVAPGESYAPHVVSEPYEWQCGGETVTSERHKAAALLTVPDVRYSQTTTRHQSACLGGRVDRDEPGRPLGADEYHGADTISLTIGERVDAGDPGAVTRGRGRSPFGSRVGW